MSSVKWASDQICPSGRAKDVLKFIARFADEEGVTWCAIPTIAEEIQASERQAQRLVRDLVAAGFMEPTGGFKYRNIPFYQLALDRVGALVAVRAARQAAIMEARRARRATPAERHAAGHAQPAGGANGDADVTVGLWGAVANGDMDVTVENANGDIPDANGDMGVTQRRVDEEEEERERARARDRALGQARRDAAERLAAAYLRLSAAWIAALPGRVDDLRARLAFDGAAGAGENPDLIADCAAAFLASAKASRDKPMLHNWLTGKRWRGFEPKPAATAAHDAAAPAFDGPAEVAELLRADLQTDWLVWGLTWDAAAGAIAASTTLAADRLDRALGAQLATRGVKIIVRRRAA